MLGSRFCPATLRQPPYQVTPKRVVSQFEMGSSRWPLATTRRAIRRPDSGIFLNLAAEARATHTGPKQQKSGSGGASWDMPPCDLPSFEPSSALPLAAPQSRPNPPRRRPDHPPPHAALASRGRPALAAPIPPNPTARPAPQPARRAADPRRSRPPTHAEAVGAGRAQLAPDPRRVSYSLNW